MQLAEWLDRVWRWMHKTSVLLGLVCIILLLMTLTFLLPQAPVPPTDEAAFLRWLAQVRTSLGASASFLASAGLLSLRTSWWMRGAFALLVLVIITRGARLMERWNEFTSYGRGLQMVIFLGTLLLFIGWGVQLRTGWIETGVSAWPGETIVLPSHGKTLEAPRDTSSLSLGGYGLYLLREDLGLGLNVAAEDEDGDLVPLRTSAQGDAQDALRLILSPRDPDAYFALPSSRLIFRVTLQASPPDPQFRVQIYQGAGGELLTETTLEGSGTLFTDDLRVKMESTPLPQLRVVYNPGAPLTLVGGIVLVMGVLAETTVQAGWLSVPLQAKEKMPGQEEQEESEESGS